MTVCSSEQNALGVTKRRACGTTPSRQDCKSHPDGSAHSFLTSGGIHSCPPASLSARTYQKLQGQQQDLHLLA
eukprot:1155545-Pelagomonas_calceolata.AAC.4